MKYIIYARRSSEDKKKQIQSIPAQLDWAKEAAEDYGVEVIKTFTDIKSGRKTGREGFREMMQFIDDSGEPLGVIVWKIDRLARNAADEGRFKHAFNQGKINHVLASDRQFHEGENQILVGIEFSNATQYSMDLSRNVTRGMKEKIKKGWRPGYAPLGYLNDRFALQGEKIIHVDEKTFSTVRKAWDYLLTGQYTVPKIAEILNEECGLRTRRGQPISLSTLYSIFSNQFYAGYFEWKGELVEGSHKSMVTLEEYDKAQIVLGRKGKPRKRNHDHAFTGIIRCGECSCMVTAEPPKIKRTKSGKTHIYHYLRCTKKNPEIKCGQSYLRVEALEDQIEEKLGEIEIPQAFFEWAIKILKRENKEEANKFAAKRGQLQKEYNNNEALGETLLQKLLKGIIDDETYKATKKRFMEEKERLKEKMAKYDEDSENRFDRIEKNFEFAKTAAKSFAEGSPAKRRELFVKLGSNFLLKDKELHVELQRPFFAIRDGIKQTKSLFGSLEPLKKGLEKVKKRDLDRAIPVWSRWRESNPRQ
jgi:site-specific DNA recombinase